VAISATGVVILIAGSALVAGFTVALRVGPPAPPTAEGSLIFFTSRLVAAAGVAAGALDIYSSIKTQSLSEEILGHPVAVRLSEQLGGAMADSGVLLGLACALGLLGARLPDRVVDPATG
jgi:hypothetical protein